MDLPLETGKVSKHLRLVEMTIREVDLLAEAVGEIESLLEEVELGESEAPEILEILVAARRTLRLQGRLANTSDKPLTGIKWNLVYYSAEDVFLGLDTPDPMFGSEMGPGEILPIDLPVHLPEGAARYVFNAEAREKPAEAPPWLALVILALLLGVMVLARCAL